jgi:hypothetical protein
VLRNVKESILPPLPLSRDGHSRGCCGCCRGRGSWIERIPRLTDSQRSAHFKAIASMKHTGAPTMCQYSARSCWPGLMNPTVAKRTKPRLSHYKCLCADDGESYYYQQLRPESFTAIGRANQWSNRSITPSCSRDSTSAPWHLDFHNLPITISQHVKFLGHTLIPRMLDRCQLQCPPSMRD